MVFSKGERGALAATTRDRTSPAPLYRKYTRRYLLSNLRLAKNERQLIFKQFLLILNQYY